MHWIAWIEAHWAKLIDVAAKLIGFAVLTGGPIIGLWKQIKTRTYAIRVELDVKGSILRADGESFLLIVSSVKNVGVSKVAFKQGISYVRVFTVESEQFEDEGPDAPRLATLPALLRSDSLESGLSTEDSQLVKIPHENYLAFIIEFGFTTGGFLNILPGRDWTKTAIINCKLGTDGVNSLSDVGGS